MIAHQTQLKTGNPSVDLELKFWFMRASSDNLVLMTNRKYSIVAKSGARASVEFTSDIDRRFFLRSFPKKIKVNVIVD